MLKSLSSLLILCLAVFVFSCDDDNDNTPTNNRTIWTGATFTFEKADNQDETLAVNQDRITSNVWITRAVNGGQIYNANSETMPNQDDSPAGTLWAIGTVDQIDNLEFKKFRAAVGSPQDVVDKDLVLYLEADDIYISVKFTAWKSGKGGGFTYERSTEN